MPADYDEGARIKRWRTNLENPTVALRQIGQLMVSASQRAFKEQRFGKKRWPRPAPINVYGIIADLSTGGRSAPRPRRFDRGRRALIDTGRLRSSIAAEVSGKTVTVGTNLSYAAVLHSGGPITSDPITPTVRRKLWKWLRGPGSRWKRDLGWLLNRKFADERLEGEVPARPFVGLTRELEDDIEELVGVRVMEAR